MRVLFVLLAFIIASCNNVNTADEKSEKTANDTTLPSVREEEPVPSSTNQKDIAGCYMRILKRDTIVLHLQQSGTSVSGKMTFDNYEKDGSIGEVRGVVESDVIKLWYEFNSEGMRSVMELNFKIADSSLIQATGPMANKADTAYFTDHTAITFSKEQALSKVSCSEVPGKYL